MSRERAVKIMTVIHSVQTGLLVLGAVEFFFIMSAMGVEEQYTFFFPTLSPDSTLLYLFYLLIVLLFYISAVFSAFLQLPYGIIYWRESGQPRAEKLAWLTVPAVLIIVQPLLIFYLSQRLSDAVPVFEIVLTIMIAATYITPALLIIQTAGGLKRLKLFKTYAFFLLSHFVIYAFLATYVQGAFPSLRQSLTGFFASYSKWK